ncbi:MAG: hypothetical protein D6689_04385 [Deltaproteobacteria bacterium]|nr:MAG: hypothetical protein D6689_04385 [Deltaproteobacteria bacterium]
MPCGTDGSMGADHTLSLGRAAAAGALAVGALGAAGAVAALAGAAPGGDAALAVRCGAMALPVFAMAAVASYCRQTGRPGYAWLFAALATLGVAAPIAAPLAGARAVEPVALAPGDRVAFELVDVGGAPHYRHPGLGFAFPRPFRGFAVNDALTGSLRASVGAGDDVYLTAFSDPEERDVLIVAIERWAHVTRDDLDGFVDAALGATVRRGTVVDRRVVWEPSFRGAELHAVAGDSHVRGALYVDDFGRGDGDYVVSVLAVSEGGDRLAPVVAAVRWRAR